MRPPRLARGDRPGTLRALTIALLAVTVLGACSAQTAAPDADASPGQPAPTAMEAPNEALQRQYEADGLAEDRAMFLAMTALDVQAAGEREAHVTATFPGGSEAEFTIRLVPHQAGAVDALPSITHVADGEFRFTLEYFVPYDAFPPDVRDRIRGASAFDAGSVVILASTRHEVSETKDGATVIVEAVVKQFNSQTMGELVKLLEGRLRGAELGNLIKSLKAGDQVRDALASSDEYQELVRELDALEECARNPTNPITKRAYRDDPGYRDRILEQVSAARGEVKSHTAAWFLAHLIKTGSSLIRSVPWLGYVVGPGTAWSKAAMQEVSRKLIDDVSKNITPCREDFQIDKTVARGELSVTYSIRYTGTKCGGLEGRWEIDSTGTLTGGGDTATIGGPWTVDIPEGSTTGTFEGEAGFVDQDGADVVSTQGSFSGIATITEDPPTLVLQVTTGSGSGYAYGFTDTSLLQPGTLTLPLEAGRFCEEE